MNFRGKAFVFFATGFGIGFLPLTPGTFGSLPGLLLCYWLTMLQPAAAAFFIVALIAVSMWVAGRAEKALGQKDPHKIVIDEIAGMTVALAGLPFDALSAVSGFVAFRFFDVLKPFPVNWLEKRFPGGAGVVMDDVGAGIYANLFVRLLLFLVARMGAGGV